MIAQMSLVDWAVTIAVVLLVLGAAWFAGQANPMGTGKLATRLSAVEAIVSAQGSKITEIEESVKLLATSTGQTAISIEALRSEVAADRGVTERTWFAVDRLQQYFIERGIK